MHSTKLRGVFYTALILLCAGLTLASVTQARATTVFETTPYFSTGYQGAGLYIDQYLGVRFEVTSTYTTSAIGGEFVRNFSLGNNKIFGAIVALSGPADFPDSGPLNTPDVLGTTLISVPGVSVDGFSDSSGPLSVTLNPGWYALVFGTQDFGATGTGGVAIPDTGHHSDGLVWINGTWRDDTGYVARYFIQAVPEPSSLVLGALSAVGGVLLASRRRRA